MFSIFCRFPFNWENPIGFSIAFILVFIIQLNFTFFMVVGLSYGIGTYILIMSLTKDIKNDLIAFNIMAKSKSKPTELFKQLFDTIQFHGAVKRCIKYNRIEYLVYVLVLSTFLKCPSFQLHFTLGRNYSTNVYDFIYVWRYNDIGCIGIDANGNGILFAIVNLIHSYFITFLIFNQILVARRFNSVAISISWIKYYIHSALHNMWTGRSNEQWIWRY